MAHDYYENFYDDEHEKHHERWKRKNEQRSEAKIRENLVKMGVTGPLIHVLTELIMQPQNFKDRMTR